MSTKEREEAFASRWSRLKRTKNAEAQPSKTTDGAPSTKVEGARNAVLVDPSTLPDIEDLLPTSDITGFLQQGVPEELKRLALRKIWSLDPAIRDFVEVAENQFDWNAVDGVPGFGELPAGVDLEALLAQAIGAAQSDDSAGDLPAVAVSDRATSEQSKEQVGAGAQQQLESSPADLDLAESEWPSGESSEDGALHKGQPEDCGRVARRRHGGALPI